MNPTFTEQQFISLFERYNSALWPTQALTIAAALAVLALLALRPRRRSTDLAVAAVLASFWTLCGVGYFLLHMTELTPAAFGFAAIFVAQVGLLVHAALRPGGLAFSGAPRWRAIAGGVVIAYALVGYPLLGLASGRAPVQSPWLGVAPCPTTIFTIGLLLCSTSRSQARLLALPILWAAIGTMAALRLGIREDLGMTASAVVAALSLLPFRRSAGSARALPVDRSLRA